MVSVLKEVFHSRRYDHSANLFAVTGANKFANTVTVRRLR
jgi:hypothetical protein